MTYFSFILANKFFNFSLSTLKRRLKSMDIRRHEDVKPVEIIEAVSVSKLVVS